ncbi:MAG: transposase, partial [Thermoanaerobaculia bacterium]
MRELIAAATGDDVRPRVVATVHTAACDLRWHPHMHALASRGGCDRPGTWHPVPYVDTRAAEKLFRQKVISFLAAEGLLDEERIALLDSWKAGHIYEVDPLLCSCAAQMRILSFITDPPVVRHILQYLHTQGIDPARGPPPPSQ